MEFKDFNATVTDEGKVFREDGREYPQRLDKYGYYRISLYSPADKRTYTYLVHRLVAKQFIPNPENRPVVNHKDLDKTNNNVTNLEWMTQAENSNHAWQNGVRTFKPRKGGKRDWRGRFNG